MTSAQIAQTDWYDTPAYYDIVFDADTPIESDFLEGALQKYGLSGGRDVLEPACGSGRLVLGLAERGYKVVGFDKNEAMLDYSRARLRQEGQAARVVWGKLESFGFTKPFDLAHCLVSTFKYLLDERHAHSHLRCIAQSLKPGGIYVLGFHLSDYEHTGCSRERWFGRRAQVSVTCNIQSWPPDRRRRLEKVRSRLLIREGKKSHKSETEWLFRTYNAAQTTRMLARVPQLEHLATYDFNYTLDRPRKLDDHRLDTVLILRRNALQM